MSKWIGQVWTWTGLFVKDWLGQNCTGLDYFSRIKKENTYEKGPTLNPNNIPFFDTNYHKITLNYAHIIILTVIILSSQLYDIDSANQVLTGANRAV